MNRNVARNVAVLGSLVLLPLTPALVAVQLGKAEWKDVYSFAVVEGAALAFVTISTVLFLQFARPWIAWLDLMRRRAIARRLGPFERKLLARIPKDPPAPERDHPYR
jgi:threonine/homoserine efflux transporter RhtA